MKNKIEDLRNHMFESIERLMDKDLDLEEEVKRSKAVADVAQTIINSAKVEVEFMKAVGQSEAAFFNTKQLGPGEKKK